MKNTKITTTSLDEQSRLTTTPEVEEAVRQRAYQLYKQRGDAPGDALGDWLEAEKRSACNY
jgi:hypothetical protein